MSDHQPRALEEAIAQAVSQHMRRDRLGQCECGEFVTGMRSDMRNPDRQVADHLTKHITAAVRRHLAPKETT